jgi:GH24 family phage-related lysozyme (muramidase)
VLGVPTVMVAPSSAAVLHQHQSGFQRASKTGVHTVDGSALDFYRHSEGVMNVAGGTTWCRVSLDYSLVKSDCDLPGFLA